MYPVEHFGNLQGFSMVKEYTIRKNMFSPRVSKKDTVESSLVFWHSTRSTDFGMEQEMKLKLYIL